MNRWHTPSLPNAVFLLLPCALLWLAGAGCSGSHSPRVPPVKEKAEVWNRRGLAAENRGDRDGALAAFEESLRLNRSIEDEAATAVCLVNLARLHRLRGDLSLAKERIEAARRLLPAESPLFPETAFEKAMIGLAEGDLPAAEDWAERAVREAKGDSAGRMLNLLARLLFLRGKEGEARPIAEEALAANRKSGARGEEANSLRLLGDIAAAGRERSKAAERYAAALAIDKDMANSRKIAADLRALGSVVAEEDAEKALAFFGRAYEVSINGGEAQDAGAALLEMARLHARMGATDKAESALAERDSLLRTVREK